MHICAGRDTGIHFFNVAVRWVRACLSPGSVKTGLHDEFVFLAPSPEEKVSIAFNLNSVAELVDQLRCFHALAPCPAVERRSFTSSSRAFLTPR